ncbi:hypothetical protein [Flavobacterium sp.]|uniref:hypothetical protein n=1 Tax=Flavobacterium sp. TaxID=239 RepID=UPI00375008C8
MIKESNIALLTTVANFELYKKTSPLFPQNIQKYVIDGTNGMHGYDSIKYMLNKLKNKNIEWLVMADEDVIFSNPNAIFEIIEHMKHNDYSVCGVRDGGMIPHRKQNPYLINTFFSIIHFSEIENIWKKKEVDKNQYIKKNEFDDNLSSLIHEYNVSSIYEPYYCFYLWLRRKGKKILFLDANVPFEEDIITNSVNDHRGNKMLYHTWYARAYGVNEKHTKRIDKIFSLLSVKNDNFIKPIIFKDNTFAFRKRISKFIAKVVAKVK